MPIASVPTLAGIASTVIFAGSTLPMLTKAVRTRDLGSYSLGNLTMANVGNAVHSVYVFSLPAGPVWLLHGFNESVAAFMLVWFLRHELLPARRRVASNDVHRWLARGEHEIPATDAWLSDREATYLSSLRFTKRRTEFLLRRWAGKHAVADVAGLSTDLAGLGRIEVANRPTGAPYVLVEGRPFELDVSLTDRAGWAVCLVGADLGRVGCDLEIVEPRSAGFVADFLTGAEQEYVAAQPDRDAVANLFWSAKESALKVLRTGLRRDTRSVEVETAPPDVSGWGRLEVRSTEGKVMPGWWRREGVFLLTMSSDVPFDPPVVLDSSADLSVAEPVHSWVEHPLAD